MAARAQATKLLKRLIPGTLIRYRGSRGGARVSLTFDDGPVPGITERIVATLAARGHRGTFFVLGNRAEAHPELIRAIAGSGSEVGNHTYSHRRVNQLSRAELAEEIERTDRLLRPDGGVSWFRPPTGRLSLPLFLYLWRRGRRVAPVLWSVLVPREHRRTAAEIVSVLETSGIREGDIVLLHDDNQALPEALPRILDLLDKRGLRSVPVDELLSR